MHVESAITKPVTTPLSAAILLAGALRPSPLVSAAGRNVLNLYLTPARTVLGRWIDLFSAIEIEGLSGGASGALSGGAPVRVIYDGNGPAPTRAGVGADERVSFEKERNQFRGPAGVVHDACEGYDDSQSILVADGARCFDGELGPLLAAHAARNADITVACEEDGSPAGLYVVRCAVLRLVPGAGFMDLKEQLLERAVRNGMGVWVHRLSGMRSYPLRTREQFLIAAGALAGLRAPETDVSESIAYAPQGAGGAAFRVVAPDAEIGEGAVVVDSVVMPGSWIGKGAVVARSIVCPGARVEPGARVVDAVVAEGGVRSDPRGADVLSGRGSKR